MFYLLIEKLHTTHDQAKLKVFGDALANSGKMDFKDDDKELYVRLIRDLSTDDILSLQDWRLQSSYSSSPNTHSAMEIARFSRLAGMGLLVE